MIKLYLLALTTVASAATLSIRDTSCTPGPIIANGRQCTIECGSDHPGGDYSALSVPNFQACINACTADSNCKTAQYLTTNSYCYLKNSIKGASSSNVVNGIVCQDPSGTSTTTSTTSVATASCTPGPIAINGRSGTVECDTDRAGGDYSSINVQTFQGCENACAADTTCITAQYNSGSNWCYLKSGANTPVKKIGIWGIVFGGAGSTSTTVTTTTTSSPTPSSTTVPPGCATLAPVSPYLPNGGFEVGTTDLSYPGGYPWNFHYFIGSSNVVEGCNALNIYPSDYYRSYIPTFTLRVGTTGLKDKTHYTLSFFLGGYQQYYSSASINVNFVIGDLRDSIYACGTNMYGYSCPNMIATTGQATGQYIQRNFTYTSDKPQYLDFTIYWLSVGTPTLVLDDIRITPLSS